MRRRVCLPVAAAPPPTPPYPSSPSPTRSDVTLPRPSPAACSFLASLPLSRTHSPMMLPSHPLPPPCFISFSRPPPPRAIVSLLSFVPVSLIMFLMSDHFVSILRSSRA